MNKVEPNVIIRMGSHAEKDYVLKTAPLMDGIAVGANLMEATPGATSSLLFKLSGPRVDTPYYIDPMTYAFGPYFDREPGVTRVDLDWIKSFKKQGSGRVRTFKKSYLSLAEKLGSVFQIAIEEEEALTPDSLANEDILKDVCTNVIDYQLNCVESVFAADDEFKHYFDKIPSPKAVFAPYFYIEPSNAGEWTQLALRLSSKSVDLYPKENVHSIICVDESFLEDRAFISQLIAEIPKTKVKGVWFWFSRLHEDKASSHQLGALRELTESLSEHLEVYNLHGGFYSLALCKHGMNGISHGVGYGEQKDVVPVVGQSTPTVNYYMPPVHRRLSVPNIERTFDDLGIKIPSDFHETICNCVVCKGVIKTDLNSFREFGEMHYSRPESKRMAQTPAAAKRCRFHFLLKRYAERDWVRNEELESIIYALKISYAKWGGEPSLESVSDHLMRWAEALEEE